MGLDNKNDSGYVDYAGVLSNAQHKRQQQLGEPKEVRRKCDVTSEKQVEIANIMVLQDALRRLKVQYPSLTIDESLLCNPKDYKGSLSALSAAINTAETRAEAEVDNEPSAMSKVAGFFKGLYDRCHEYLSGKKHGHGGGHHDKFDNKQMLAMNVALKELGGLHPNANLYSDLVLEKSKKGHMQDAGTMFT